MIGTDGRKATVEPPLGPMPPGMGEAGLRVLNALLGVDMPLREIVRAVKWHAVDLALRKYHFNISETARALGMHRNTLARTIDELGMREHVEKLMREQAGAAE